MNKIKWGMPLVALALLLAGCSEKPEKVIMPDKEPNEVVKDVEETGTPEKPVALMIADIASWYEHDKTLRDYTEEMANKGYDKPYKDMVLAVVGGYETKKGMIYEVEDGFAMFEYDPESETVVAITGYQTALEFEIQEMKTMAYVKENELDEEEDEAKKASLQAEIDAMWTEIGELENN